jgi:hypothetical protein
LKIELSQRAMANETSKTDRDETGGAVFEWVWETREATARHGTWSTHL